MKYVLNAKWLIRSIAGILVGMTTSLAVQAAVVSFGSGANQFNMDFVPIGNPGNAPDTTGNPSPAGSVAYTYQMGKCEVNRDMIIKYNSRYGNANSLAISLADMSPYGGNGINKPATGVSWNEAARFVNWLNTSTGNQAAYKFTTSAVNDNIALWTSGDAGYDASNPYRNSLAKYVLPSYNEWYKASYYDPSANNGAGGYWYYPTGSNTAPNATTSGTASNTAIFNLSVSQGPADVDQAGGLSPYGVMGLGGNAWEWEESSFDRLNSNIVSSRGIRGGQWGNVASSLSSGRRDYNLTPNSEADDVSFRVVMMNASAAPVPEPSMMVIGTLFGLGGLVAKRRMKK